MGLSSSFRLSEELVSFLHERGLSFLSHSTLNGNNLGRDPEDCCRFKYPGSFTGGTGQLCLGPYSWWNQIIKG